MMFGGKEILHFTLETSAAQVSMVAAVSCFVEASVHQEQGNWSEFKDGRSHKEGKL